MKTIAVAALAASLAAAAPAQADILKFVANTNAQVFDTTVATPIDLSSDSGAQSEIKFSLDSRGRVLITFMAECSIAGDFSAWADIDIQVKLSSAPDFVTLAPTSSDNAFCSGGSDTQNNWVSAAASGAIAAPAGNHLARVLVRRGFTSGSGPNTIRIDDTSLSIQN